MNRGSGHLKLKDTSAYWEGILTESITKGGRRRPFASKAGYCPTANWFMGDSKGEFVVGASMKLYQGIGNGVEAEIVAAAERKGIMLGTQVKLPTPFGVDIGGFIDLIAIGSDGSPTLYEIKTCTNLPNKIKPEHAAQAATYWLFSGMERVEIIYVSRKVQNFPDPTPLIKTFQFDPTEWSNEIENVFTTLATFNGAKPPQRPPHFVKNRQCMFCDFANRCWDMNDSEFLSNKQMSDIDKNAGEHRRKILSERAKYVSKTLENCKTSVPAGNAALLDDFIKKAKR
jgi:hypothetical protein